MALVAACCACCWALSSDSRWAFSRCVALIASRVLNLSKRGSKDTPPASVSEEADFPPEVEEIEGPSLSSIMSMKRSSEAASASSAANSATVLLRALGRGGLPW